MIPGWFVSGDINTEHMKSSRYMLGDGQAVLNILLKFHYTGWSMAILIMAYHNPYITGAYNPQDTANS